MCGGWETIFHVAVRIQKIAYLFGSPSLSRLLTLLLINKTTFPSLLQYNETTNSQIRINHTRTMLLVSSVKGIISATAAAAAARTTSRRCVKRMTTRCHSFGTTTIPPRHGTKAWRAATTATNNNTILMWGAAAVIVLSVDSSSSSSTRHKTYNHCQVPCGIFDDPAVVREIHQAILTIRKAMVQTNALTAQCHTDPLALNQAVRWITVKEQHAAKIIEYVAEYCLCQRVKRSLFESEGEYLHALKLHHAVMQAAMKTKQSVSEADCDALMQAAERMAQMYTK